MTTAESAEPYVDAGEAIDQGRLSGKIAGGEVAPPVAENLTYERIVDARSEPENWLTYYGTYDGQRFSALDQINTTNVAKIGPPGSSRPGSAGSSPAPRRTRSRPPRSWSTG